MFHPYGLWDTGMDNKDPLAYSILANVMILVGPKSNHIETVNMMPWIKTGMILSKGYRTQDPFGLHRQNFVSIAQHRPIPPIPATSPYCDIFPAQNGEVGWGWWWDVWGFSHPIWWYLFSWSSSVSVHSIVWDLWHPLYLKGVNFARLFYTESMTWTATSLYSNSWFGEWKNHILHNNQEGGEKHQKDGTKGVLAFTQCPVY
jgi:hypothetical protein